MNTERTIRSLERDVRMWEQRFWAVTAILFALGMCKLGAVLGKWLAMILTKM